MIFYSGSQKSYVSYDLRDALNLPTVRREMLTIKTFGSEIGRLKSYDVTQFAVRSPYDGVTVFVSAYVVPTVCAPLRDQATDLAVAEYPYLNGLPLADFPATNDDEMSVHILIGSDFYWNFMKGGVIKSQGWGPVAMESVLGWILSGPISCNVESAPTVANFAQAHTLRVSEIKCTEAMNEQLSRFWDLESLGISPKEESVYEQFSEEIAFVDGRYEVKLPWKANHPVLPDNYQLAKKRSVVQLSKVSKSPDLLKEYDAILKEQEEKGIIEKVNHDQESPVGKTHFLLHQPVVRQDKNTTKVRIVCDASEANNSGTSLTNCLYPGPCLLKTVADILTRFRLYPLGLTADIKKAFLMISINEADRDVLRFIWYSDVNAANVELIVYRFCRVVFGLTCSPFLLNATLSHHIKKYQDKHPDVCAKLLNSLYVDDVNTRGYSVEEVYELFNKSKQWMSEGGFNLRKWNSNSEELLKKVEEFEKCRDNIVLKESATEDEQSYAKATIGKGTSAEDSDNKVLGIIWSTKTDALIIKFSEIVELAKSLPATKRNVLKIIAKLFDPLGLVTPISTPLKVLMQELFQSKYEWDERFSDDLARRWNSLIKELEQVNQIEVSRYYFQDIQKKPETLELFGFFDSSEKAYVAVVYAKVTFNGNSAIAMVTSKSRVAPLSRKTIPRLELLSCLILARLITSVKGALSAVCNVKIVRCWTDSITAYYWIESVEKHWKLFVENRVQEIRKLVPPDIWCHCPGVENPADIPTRKVKFANLAVNNIWWYGPEWLLGSEDMWPKKKRILDIPDHCVSEMKGSDRNSQLALHAQAEQ